MVRPFRYRPAPQAVTFGPGRLGEVAEEAGRFGPAFVVASSDRAGLASRVAGLVGAGEEARFFSAAPHTPVAVSEAATEALDQSGAACVVSVGGGSATGLAKALAFRRHVPVVAVPTTYAGSEMTSILGQSESGRKWTLRDDAVRPRSVVYDVELTLALPPRLSTASGCNALAHAVEALWDPDAAPVLRLLAEEAIRLLVASLPDVVADGGDLEARGAALYGAYLAATCLGECAMALHHRICHVVGGRFELAHAETHAVVLPHVVAFYGRGEPAERLAGILGCPPGEVASELFALLGRLGLPRSLAELGLPDGGAAEVAGVLAEAGGVGPVPLTRAGLVGLLDRAAQGSEPRHA